MTALLALLAAAAQPAAAPPPTAYQPQGKDERGLWMQMEEEERRIKASNLVIRDPALNDYVRGVLCRTVGPRCEEVRLYLIRTADFNAAMGPNGAMLVYSGLLLRMRDEAQLAGVLGHEWKHYEEQHSLKQFRDIKHKVNAATWLAMPMAAIGGDLALTAMQFGVIGSIYGFSREQERDADRGSLVLLGKAGYDPMAVARVWQGLRAETEAAAAARGRKPRREGGLLATHPATQERMVALAELAKKTPVAEPRADVRTRFDAAMAGWRAQFLDDQVKLNDFGGTEWLLARLAEDGGWTSDLTLARADNLRMRGRPEDLKQAAALYGQLTARTDAPPAAWRGLGLTKLRLGEREAGRAALTTYLARDPQAKDAAMLRTLTETDS